MSHDANRPERPAQTAQGEALGNMAFGGYRPERSVHPASDERRLQGRKHGGNGVPKANALGCMNWPRWGQKALPARFVARPSLAVHAWAFAATQCVARKRRFAPPCYDIGWKPMPRAVGCWGRRPCVQGGEKGHGSKRPRHRRSVHSTGTPTTPAHKPHAHKPTQDNAHRPHPHQPKPASAKAKNEASRPSDRDQRLHGCL